MANADTAARMAAETDAAPLLEARALTCVRDDRVLFSDLGFALWPGTLLQVAGPNGCGKTTLLRVLCGLSWAESGSVHWRGEDIGEAGATFAADLAYVGHASGVKADLTALENLRTALRVAGVQRSESQLMQALADSGLAGYEDVPARALSAGQVRRVALARLQAGAARLWVLDEPLTALDSAGRRMVESMLARHSGAGGVAVLTTHQPLDMAALPSVDSIRLGRA